MATGSRYLEFSGRGWLRPGGHDICSIRELGSREISKFLNVNNNNNKKKFLRLSFHLITLSYHYLINVKIADSRSSESDESQSIKPKRHKAMTQLDSICVRLSWLLCPWVFGGTTEAFEMVKLDENGPPNCLQDANGERTTREWMSAKEEREG